MGTQDQFRDNFVTGKIDEAATREENLALNDLINRGEKITLDSMRQLTRPQIEEKLSPAVKALLGPDPQFILENRWGDKRREDEKGNVTSFTYVDKVGNELHKVTHVMRDTLGQVIRFDDSRGRRWEKEHYVWEPDNQISIWSHLNKSTGTRSQFTYDLGEVKVDKNGIHASGTNSAALNLPRREVSR
jgi:hypothetical protein